MHKYTKLVFAVALASCGGDDGDHPADATVPADGGIAGTTPFTARMMTYDASTRPGNAPVAGSFARLESERGALELQTGSDGVATFMVDPAKGPFTVTFAKPGVGAVTVYGAGSSVGDIYTSLPVDVVGTITGAITGKQGSGDSVVVGSYTARGAPSTTGSYNLQAFSGSAQDVIALELGSDGAMVNATQVTTSVGSDGAVHGDIAFPATPPVFETTHATVHFPRTGAASKISVPTNLARFGNPCAVGALQTDPTALFTQLALRSVGCGTSTVPDAAGTATITLQSLGGDLAATAGFAIYNSPDGSPIHAVVSVPPVEGFDVTLPSADLLSLDGMSADTLLWTAAGAGYTEATVALIDGKGNPVWGLSGPPSSTGQALPVLPGGLHLSDLTADNTLTVAMDLLIFPAGVVDYQPSVNFVKLLGLATSGRIQSSGR